MKAADAGGYSDIPIEFLEKTAGVLRLLAHPHRLKIIEILQTTGGAPVYDIARRLGLSPAATSQHLNQMRRSGLARAERRGREVWYRIDDETTISILNCVRKRRAAS